jgi:hypothetical protein
MKKQRKFYQRTPSLCVHVSMHELDGEFYKKQSTPKRQVNKCITCNCKSTCKIFKTTDFAYFARVI